MKASIHSSTRIGAVHLTVVDLDTSLAFYQEVLGMALRGRGRRAPGSGADSKKTARLGAGAAN